MADVSASVLITDGDERAALACVRALGRSGHRCFVLAPARRSLAGASRFCEAGSVCPDPSDDRMGFVECVEERIHALGPGVLLPITEKSLRALLPERHSLGVSVPFPSLEVFSAVSDKENVLRVAQGLGIPVPRQRVWSSPAQAQGDRVSMTEFPLAIKPTISVPPPRPGRASFRGVEYIMDARGLERWIANSDPEGYPVLVQERVVGHGIGVFLLIWDGSLRAVVGHRRIREKPPSGGVSVVRESTVPDGKLLEYSLDLLRTLGWTHGVAMVEFKRDARSGIPYLMEVNGRFWGSLQLAVDAGVDFPTLLLRCASGEPPRDVVRGTPGIRTRWLLGDVDQLATRLLRNRQDLGLPPGFPSRGRTLWDFLADFRPGVRLEVLRFSDLGPFLCELGSWFGHLSSWRPSR